MKTKIKRIILVWLFLMAILPIIAQKRDQVISDQEVKVRYKLGADSIELMKYDAFNNVYFIRKSEKLHALQKILLPASVWGIFYREKDAAKNDLCKYDRNHPRAFPKDAECILCWLGLRDGLNQDESSIRKKLIKKYGTINATDRKGKSVIGIPAKWVTDTLTTSFYAYYYAGLWTQCFRGMSLAIKDGNATECRLENNERTYNTNLYFTVMDMAPQYYMTTGDNNSAKKAKWLEMTLLAYDVNKLCAKKNVLSEKREQDKKREIKKIALPIYIRTDSISTYRIEKLDDRQLSKDDSVVFDDLKKSFSKLPLGLFHSVALLDGQILPGRLFMAYWDGTWRFRDLQYDEAGWPGLDLFRKTIKLHQ